MKSKDCSLKKTPIFKLPHRDVYARLKASEIHGIGVFAIQNIPKGTYIFPDDDEELIWVHKRELAGLSPEVKKLYDDFCVIKGDLYGCPRNFNKLTPTWYFNESETPNVAGRQRISILYDTADHEGRGTHRQLRLLQRPTKERYLTTFTTQLHESYEGVPTYLIDKTYFDHWPDASKAL